MATVSDSATTMNSTVSPVNPIIGVDNATVTFLGDTLIIARKDIVVTLFRVIKGGLTLLVTFTKRVSGHNNEVWTAEGEILKSRLDIKVSYSPNPKLDLVIFNVVCADATEYKCTVISVRNLKRTTEQRGSIVLDMISKHKLLC